MLQVSVKVMLVLGVEFRGLTDHQQIFRVACFCLLRKVEAARDQGLSVDQYDLVVGNRVFGINIRFDAGMDQKICGRELLGSLALVENDLHLHAALVCRFQGFGDGCRCE
mgnify:CR=1 FL=1